MRHSATRSLLEHDDVIIVASVVIYGVGSVETYSAMTFTLEQHDRIDQRQLIADLVALLTSAAAATSIAARPGPRRRGLSRPLRGPRPGGFPCSATRSVDPRFDPLTGRKTDELEYIDVYANSH